jgi:hypothetical protein
MGVKLTFFSRLEMIFEPFIAILEPFRAIYQ